MAQGDTLLVHASAAPLATAFQGTANDAARMTPAIDAAGAVDCKLRLRARLAGAGTGVIEVYVAASLNDGQYVDGATGSDAVFTASNRQNAPLAGYLQMNGTAEQIGIISTLDAFPSGVLPRQFCYIFINKGGAAIDADAADFEAETQLVYPNTALT